MKHAKALIVIAITSLALSILGFIIDLGERVQNILTNIFEVLVMTGIIFIIITTIYLAIITLKKIVLKLKIIL